VEATVTEARVALRGSLLRLATAAYCCDVAGGIAREGHAEPRLFGLLETMLLLLDAAHEDPKDALLAGFEAKALTFVGVTPVLTRCVACGDPLDGTLLYAPGVGGLVHRRCAPEENATPVSAEHALALEAARRRPLAESLDLSLPPGPRGLLYGSIAAHLGRALHARAVLDSVS
jgi:DNA repair protein RecO (recombination protein O)